MTPNTLIIIILHEQFIKKLEIVRFGKFCVLTMFLYYGISTFEANVKILHSKKNSWK